MENKVKHCQSCAAPLTPEFKGASDAYCMFCADEKGTLKERDAVQKCIAEWFMMWQPNLDLATAMTRADYYMKAMPAWAD